ncbi:MAG: 4a-hydroxytetrahydrobiopterin dehydratase [Flavobacteriaceae bacterium]
MSTSKGWREEQGRLRKELNFRNFKMAVAYINKVAQIAEQHNHHPKIINIYNQVILELWTHDENAITDLDWKLAKAIDELDENFK